MDPRGDTTFTVGYDLGSIGAWLRLLLGVAFSGVFLARGISEDVSDAGIVVIAGVVGLFTALLAAYTLALWWLGPRVLARRSPWLGTALLYGPILAAAYVDLPGTVELGIGIYIAVSTLVVVFLRYGGCEVIGIPMLFLHRRYTVYCPWNLHADLADRRLAVSGGVRPGRWPRITAAAAIALVTVGLSGVGGLPQLRWEPRLLLAAAAGLGTVELWRIASRLRPQPQDDIRWNGLTSTESPAGQRLPACDPAARDLDAYAGPPEGPAQA